MSAGTGRTAVPTTGRTPVQAPAEERPLPHDVAPRPHPWRVVAYVVLALLLAEFAYTLVTNENWKWPVVAEYLFDSEVLGGIKVTVILTLGAMLLGLVLGGLVAGLRMSQSKILSGIAQAYIWFFRGVPVIVQVIFWVYLAQLYPTLSLGVPFGGPQFVYFDTNVLIAPMVGAVLGLCVNESAYLAEIIRGSVNAVPKGQIEAARALGMTPAQIRRRVLTPQILPVALPPFFNNIIAMTKTTAVVILASVTDLFSAVMQIGARNLEQTPLLMVATFWYLLITAGLSLLQSVLERLVSRRYVSR